MEKDHRYGNNLEDWVIRIQAPKPATQGHGEGSETGRRSVDNDELATPSRLKVQSAPMGNYGDQAFDGDEMNIFIPQSMKTMIELQEIADVRRQIITPRLSTPIIGIVQDGLLGSYNMTKPTMTIDWHDAMDIVSYTTIDDFSHFKKKDYKGSDLFSMIIPPGINTTGKVRIEGGVIKSGSIAKAQLGATKKNSLIHLVWDEYGSVETQKFIDNVQRLVNNFNLYNGFSVGIGDIEVSEETEKEIETMFETEKLNVLHMITEMENNPELLDPDVFENEVYHKLNTLRERASSKIKANLSPENGFNVMMTSGSKGGSLNIGQMGGCVGQQAVEGQRIRKRVNGRTLHYFHRDDDSAPARGFIQRPYLHGMKLPEFIFHNMSAREGLIDTAIKSVTGDTRIVITENNEARIVEIGSWIDQKMESESSRVEHHDERDLELLKLMTKVKIPTTDSIGNVTWGDVTAITRHDPGDNLYKVTTRGKRSVIVTEAKSLLVWNEDEKQFLHTSMDVVKVGDGLPTTANLPPVDFTPSFRKSNAMDFLDCSKQHCQKLVEGNSTLDTWPVVPGTDIEGDIAGLHATRAGTNTDTNTGFSLVNDVWIDPIVSIKKVDVTEYPKVYDLTVPSTLNFGLANGLHVVDTAESGYVQRKLIKALEDAMIKYDGTCRNANNKVIQFIYGDNGIDTTKQTEHTMEIIKMSNTEIADRYGFTNDELKKHKMTPADNKDYISRMVTYRDQLRWIQLCTRYNYSVIIDNFMFPCNFYRIIANHRGKKMSGDALTPKHVIDSLNDVLSYEKTKLMALTGREAGDPDNRKNKDEKLAKSMFEFALHEFLAPRRCLIEYGFNKAVFDKVIEEVIKSYNRGVAEPSEMVGIIAAQSTGEPVTQMSVCCNTQVHLSGKEIQYRGAIGQFVDDQLEKYRKHVEVIKKDSIVLDMKEDFYVANVTDDEKVQWQRISQVSRHPSNGGLVRIKTNTGREVTATKSHSFLRRSVDGIVPIKGSDLKKGMRVPVAKSIPVREIYKTITYNGTTFKLDKRFGWFCGAYLAEGSLSEKGYTITITNIHESFKKGTQRIATRFGAKMRTRESNGEYGKSVSHVFNSKPVKTFLEEHFGRGSFNKFVSPAIFHAPEDFISSLLKGYMDGDGNVNDDENRSCIRYGSRSLRLRDDIAMLLNYFGIVGSRLVEKKKGNNVPFYTYIIPKKYAKQFKTSINTNISKKKVALKSIIKYIKGQKNVIQDNNDKIPNLGKTLAKVGKGLRMPGASRNYGRWEKKESIGRRTLEKYIGQFEGKIREINDLPMKSKTRPDHELDPELDILKQAMNADVIWDEIVEIEYLDDPDEYVYDFTVPGNDSFMVETGLLVHNTLDSVDWTERLRYRLNGSDTVEPIGQMIDRIVTEYSTKSIGDNTEKEMGDVYYQEVSGYEVPTVDELGNVFWAPIKAVTKHLPINTDGTNTLVKVTTESGRTVTATKAKSFLHIDNGIVREIRGDAVFVGMQIPLAWSDHTKCLNDVASDKVAKIEYIEPSNKYVYDLTVEPTKNFILANGLAQRDTFHSTGIASMGTSNLGVGRVKELLSFTKNPKEPVMAVYFDEETRKNRAMVNKIAYHIKKTTIGDLARKINTFYDPKPFKKGGFMEKDNVRNVFYSHTSSKHSCQSDLNALPWLMRIEFDREKLLNKEVTLLDVKSRFCSQWERRFTDLKAVKKDERQLLEKVTQCAVVTNNDNDKVPIMHLRLDMSEFNLTTLISFQDLIVEKFQLKGIDNIEDIKPINEEKLITYGADGEILDDNQYVIYTDGINMADIRYLNFIDLDKIICNDVVKIYEEFGIEAARASLLKELRLVFEAAGNTINYQHLSVLVDVMTNNGTLTSIDRYGMNRMDTDPLARASFEKTIDQMLTASVFSETDHMRSVSSRIMAGQVIRGGTGMCDLMLDMDKLQNSEYIEEVDEKYQKSFHKLSTDAAIHDVVENVEEDDVGTFMPM